MKLSILSGVATVDELKKEVEDELSRGTCLSDIISTPGVVQKIRVKLWRAHGASGVKLFSEYLDSLPLETRRTLLDPHPSATYAANLSYLIPGSFWEAYPHYFNIAGQNFDANDSAVFFSKESSALKLFDVLRNSGFELDRLSPSFLLTMALSATCYLDEESEKYIHERVRSVCKDRDNRYRLVDLAVALRMKSHREKTPERFGGKTAIIVSGQMRAMDSGLPDVLRHFDIPNSDVYVSTWMKEGRTKIDRMRIPRVFEPDAIKIVDGLTDAQLLALDSLYDSKTPASIAAMTEKITSIVPGIDPSRIEVADERMPVFASMSNAAKMHYHNMVWTRKLGPEFFSNNYDYIIKVRPDIRLVGEKNLITLKTLRSLGPRDLGDDHPSWLLEPWGFGIGDQLFYGRADVVEKILSTWAPVSISTRLQTELLGKPEPLQGHVNLGLELWMLGCQPVGMPLVKNGLVPAERISKSELEKLIGKLQ